VPKEKLACCNPLTATILEERIPGNLQETDNEWFGLSQRAPIFYSKKP